MTLAEYVHKHCVAQGGNWTSMLLSGMKEVFPEKWEALPDKSYEFREVLEILAECGIEMPND